MSKKSFTFRFIRLTPDKLRLAAGLVRRKPVSWAQEQLRLRQNKSAGILAKYLKSAETACKLLNFQPENLVIESINVNEGPRLKRIIPGARGRTNPFQRRMCHLNLTISDEIIGNSKSKITNTKAKITNSKSQITNRKPESKPIKAEKAKEE